MPGAEQITDPELVADIKGVHVMIGRCAEIFGKPPMNEEAPTSAPQPN
jgi:hypothetical protein